MKIDQADFQKLKQRLKKIEKLSVKQGNAMIKRMSIVFIRAAAKLTKPGKTFKVSTMAKKFRFRPVVANPVTAQRQIRKFWYKNIDNGKIFSVAHEISVKKSSNQRLQPITRAIKIWDKKRRRFIFKGTELRRGMHDKQETRIPGAGAGKAGWLYGLRKLNKPANTGKISGKVNVTTVRTGVDPLVTILNKVDYVFKTSGGVDGKALATTERYFRGIEEKKFEKMKTK